MPPQRPDAVYSLSIMKILAVNGSPRRDWNTERILDHAVRGALRAVPAASESVQLYPMHYSGCVGCYACKRKDQPSGLCRLNDTLTPILEKAQASDVLLLATPVYFFGESAGVRAFIERLLYPWTTFTVDGYGSRCPRPLCVGLLYTLSGTEQRVMEQGRQSFSDSTVFFFSLHSTWQERMCVYETLHTDDYSRLELDFFDPAARKKIRTERFPEDCERAYALGASLALKEHEFRRF